MKNKKMSLIWCFSTQMKEPSIAKLNLDMVNCQKIKLKNIFVTFVKLWSIYIH